MIQYKTGNPIKEVKKGILVHGCNAQGVMASGFAKELRATYPEVFTDYAELIREAKSLALNPVGLVVLTVPEGLPNLTVVSGITQEFYGRDPTVRYVDYNAIHEVMAQVNTLAKNSGIYEVHMPKIGAGLGNGDWEIISKIIDFNIISKDIYVWSLT